MDELANDLGLDPYPRKVRGQRAIHFLWRIPWIAWQARISLRKAADLYHWWVWYGSWEWPPAALKLRKAHDRSGAANVR